MGVDTVSDFGQSLGVQTRSTAWAWCARHWRVVLLLAAASGVTAGLVAYLNGQWLHVRVRPQSGTFAGAVTIGVAFFAATVVLLVTPVFFRSWRRRRASGTHRAGRSRS